ncbi:rod shape-determining protein [Parathalassolituus penaei]|uniref:Rod shape-determining protein n=1 Tax=Parathalassolituus penaei TaxID=2997323 RepID=A0A9X3EGS8_9GAMM|nr:rod shape-determining protein [Parathalassolituus penaei]MCY0967272.1 rod shape-determining protein [Parathalassolituus penaei]
MFRSIQNFFSPLVYLQIWSQRIRLVNINTGVVYEDIPWLAVATDAKGKKSVVGFGKEALAARSRPNVELLNPFDHPRMILADFEIAEKTLSLMLPKVLSGNWLKRSPRLLIQPMEKLEGGLAGVERVMLVQMALGAGANQVITYTGPDLDPAAIDWAAMAKNMTTVQKQR